MAFHLETMDTKSPMEVLRGFWTNFIIISIFICLLKCFLKHCTLKCVHSNYYLPNGHDQNKISSLSLFVLLIKTYTY